MSEVISFFFDIQRQAWTLVVNNWIIAIFVLISLVNLVITVINNTTGNNG